MDTSLFQFGVAEVLIAPKPFGIADGDVTQRPAPLGNQKLFWRTRRAKFLRISWANANRNFYRESFSIKQVILAILFFLMATPALGQTSANKAGQSSPQTQSFAEINQHIQQVRENPAGAATQPQITNESRIGPDDLLNISVFEAPEMNCMVRVSSSGEISLQLLGPVHAAGLTSRELESVLQGLLRQTYMKDPHVGVFVQELQSHGVSVVGAVKMPGIFQIRETKTVIEVLSMAQGLAPDAGDTLLIMHRAGNVESSNFTGVDPIGTGIIPAQRHDAMLTRINGSKSVLPEEKNIEIEQINLKKLLDSADSALNVPVHAGDIVKVPRAGIVYVVGEVHKSGGFVLQNNENISVLQALALAEGPTHTSAIRRARIIRTDSATGKRIEIPMNLGKIFSGNAPDMLLQPKDIVFVPNSAAKNVLYRGSEAALQTAAGAAIYRW